VPSEITYRDEGLIWVSNIPPNVQGHMWTKLQLDPKQGGKVAKIVREVWTSNQGSHKEPIEIIAGFLAQVKAHLITNLDRKYGKTLWRTLDITLVVTVPAVWTDLVKSRTLAAVDKAGFNQHEFSQLKNTVVATEPESAAIYTIKTLQGMYTYCSINSSNRESIRV
jgi:molecular chaperone DnaK (HSP70)